MTEIKPYFILALKGIVDAKMKTSHQSP